MDNKVIIEILAKHVCNRTIVYGSGKHHGITEIYAKNEFVALHEITHWIAAEPSQRDEPNMGLPLRMDGSLHKTNPDLYNRMQTEELLACGMSRMIYDKYLNPDAKMEKMVDGMVDIAKDCSDMFDTYAELEKRATELFERYCYLTKEKLLSDA